MKKLFHLFILALTVNTLTAQESLLNKWDSLPDILSHIVAPTFNTTGAATYNIISYGAVADSTTLCTTAINNAITACSNAGGGKVIVPVGTFLTGAIHLKSNVNLYLSKGARLKFSTNPAHYLPVVLTRFEGVECYNYSPFIYAYNQTNIAITGSGVLDGNASTSNWWGWKTSGDANRTTLLNMGETGVPVSSRVFGTGYKIRPVFIQPHTCKNILIDSVTILRSPMWEINPVLCENVTVSNVTISSHGVNNDGCNPECSKYVLIKNCIFDTGDDCIAIKSGRNNDGRRVNVPSEYIVIQNCTMKDGHGGVVLGSEISGSVRNVFAENCVMSSPNLDRALRIKTNSVRGGIIENIFMRNIQVPQVGSAYIEVNMEYEEGDAGNFTPIVRNIYVDNMTGNNSPSLFNINCYERTPITNLILKNCTLTASDMGNYFNVRKLQLINTTVNGLVPLQPTTISTYQHAELFSSKTNWGWSNVHTGFTGNSYMEAVDANNSLEFTLTRTSAESDSIIFVYANPTPETKSCMLYVNGEAQTTVNFPPSSLWTTKKAYINLAASSNTFSIQGDENLFIDRFTASYYSIPIPLQTAEATKHPFNLSIYPNPANKEAQISYTLRKDEKISFTLYNPQGKVVAQWKDSDALAGRNQTQLKKELKPGVYFLEIKTAEGESEYIKFVTK